MNRTPVNVRIDVSEDRPVVLAGVRVKIDNDDNATVEIYKKNNDSVDYDKVKNYVKTEDYRADAVYEGREGWWEKTFLKNNGTDNEYFIYHVADDEYELITERVSPKIGGGKRRRKSKKKSKKRCKSKRKSKRRKSTKRKSKRR